MKSKFSLTVKLLSFAFQEALPELEWLKRGSSERIFKSKIEGLLPANILHSDLVAKVEKISRDFESRGQLVLAKYG